MSDSDFIDANDRIVGNEKRSNAMVFIAIAMTVTCCCFYGLWKLKAFHNLFLWWQFLLINFGISIVISLIIASAIVVLCDFTKGTLTGRFSIKHVLYVVLLVCVMAGLSVVLTKYEHGLLPVLIIPFAFLLSLLVLFLLAIKKRL